MASNVFVNELHIEEFFQQDLRIPFESIEIKDFNPQKSTFLSQILSCIYNNFNKSFIEKNQDIFSILIKIPNEKFCSECFTFLMEDYSFGYNNMLRFPIIAIDEINQEKYLELLNIIRSLINSCEHLTIHEKGELCKLERILMKIYLKQKNLKDII